ncbi:MAG: hypothetical protein U5N58_01725 [Actinomycetota bacterium]|nr:hypothetical protein [Actinomycetota bacterium]
MKPVPNGIEKNTEDAHFTDGMFPLLTNIEAGDLLMAEILDKYKFQALYRKKASAVIKASFEAAPVFLKLPHRHRGTYVFILLLYLPLNALIEWELRLCYGQ